MGRGRVNFVWVFYGFFVWVFEGLFVLEARFKAVAGLKACPVFGVFLCLGGVLRFFVCEVGQVRLLVFDSVQVGEGSSCLCL